MRLDFLTQHYNKTQKAYKRSGLCVCLSHTWPFILSLIFFSYCSYSFTCTMLRFLFPLPTLSILLLSLSQSSLFFLIPLSEFIYLLSFFAFRMLSRFYFSLYFSFLSRFFHSLMFSFPSSSVPAFLSLSPSFPLSLWIELWSSFSLSSHLFSFSLPFISFLVSLPFSSSLFDFSFLSSYVSPPFLFDFPSFFPSQAFPPPPSLSQQALISQFLIQLPNSAMSFKMPKSMWWLQRHFCV